MPYGAPTVAHMQRVEALRTFVEEDLRIWIQSELGLTPNTKTISSDYVKQKGFDSSSSRAGSKTYVHLSASAYRVFLWQTRPCEFQKVREKLKGDKKAVIVRILAEIGGGKCSVHTEVYFHLYFQCKGQNPFLIWKRAFVTPKWPVQWTPEAEEWKQPTYVNARWPFPMEASRMVIYVTNKEVQFWPPPYSQEDVPVRQTPPSKKSQELRQTLLQIQNNSANAASMPPPPSRLPTTVPSLTAEQDMPDAPPHPLERLVALAPSAPTSHFIPYEPFDERLNTQVTRNG